MSASPSPRSGGLLLSDRYHMLDKLGSGSFGTVYLVEDLLAGRKAALKVLRPERLGDRNDRRLQEEFRALADLRHPQLATAYDFGYAEGSPLPFYTREYVAGVPLRSGPPEGEDPETFLAPILDLLDALHYLHTHEILHLDVHAGNLIEARDAERGAVLIDFGLVRPDLPLALSRSWSGGAPWPREMLGSGTVSPATDVYLAGRLLLFRLTGDGEGRGRLPREIPRWGSRLTLALERIVGKALESEASRRFSSALEFREALSTALGARGGRARHAEPGELTLGRDRELERLDAALAVAGTGAAVALWIEGARGSGKTRLLTEARWRAQLRGLETTWVPFAPPSGTRPELPRVLASVERAGGGEGGWLAALDRRHGGSSLDRARRAAASFFAEEGFPLVVLLDDLERADRESRLLAEALLLECGSRSPSAKGARGLAVIVASARPLEAEPRRKLPRASLLSLGPLPSRTACEALATLLRPLEVPPALVRRLARETGGNPLRLRRAAAFLHAEHGASGRVPKEAALPHHILRIERADVPRDEPVSLDVLRALALFGGSAEKEELAAACDRSLAEVDRALAKLRKADSVRRVARGRSRLFYLADPDEGKALARRVPPRLARVMRRRAVEHLRRRARRSARQEEALALHLVALGKHREGREAAIEGAARLASRGLLDRAAALLEEALRRERSGRSRVRLAEEMSEIHAGAGDHVEGIASLEPVFRKEKGRLDARAAVRVRRRLGVHHHRAGRPHEAVRLFAEARRLADRCRDREELVTIFSELAELHTFRGEYGEAEAACHEGLELLEEADSPDFRGAMEVTLRASLGHLELRRLSLENACRELERADALARSYGARSDHALILNNLGIAYNQLSDFDRARRAFHRAEKLLAAVGERRSMVHVACNLAVIAAKRAEAAAADREMERAWRLLREQPGERLEFFVGLSQALEEHLLGRMGAAIRSFERSLPLGRELQDDYLVRFGEVYLAEAHLACGAYGKVLPLLRGVLAHAAREGPPVLARMAAARLLFVETALLGRPRAAARAARALESAPRTDIEILEAWNDLFLAYAAPGEDARRARLAAAREAFSRLGVPAGERCAVIALLADALGRRETGRVRSLVGEIEKAPEIPHRLIAVAEPLALAEVSLELGEVERAATSLREAAGAIAGEPFLELDRRIELLGARVAEREGDPESARHHLHRSLQARELLGRSVPPRLRQGFLHHPRFASDDELRARLERPVALRSTPPDRRGSGLPGVVGTSAALREVAAVARRAADLDLPVTISGATGTGKELVARAIHRLGRRRDARCHSLHCASLPRDLFESELFGHEKGAFTGAEEARPGLLEHLAGGTLVLDEITSLPLETQAKLLRVIQSGIARPLGSLDTRPIDVRFIALTSVDPRAAVERGELREDLYYRLGALTVRLPELRDRAEDIPLLLDHFLRHHGRRLERTPPAFSAGAPDALRAHAWPGNVRELETFAVRVLVEFSPGALVGRAEVGKLLAARRPARLFPDELLAGRGLEELRRELERAYLEKVFLEKGGSIREVSAALGVRRSNLYSWFRRVGVDVRELRRRLRGTT